MNQKNIEDIYPLSSAQQGMLFHCLSAPESKVYLGQLALTIEGKLNVEAFEKAWRETAHRHSALRTLFVWDRGDKPLQIVLRQITVPFAIYDRRLQSQSESLEFLDSFLEADRRRGFILSEAPLMRIALIRAAEDLYYFLWSHHHLILDGWSVPIVLKEVFELYGAFCRGETLRLQPSRPFHEYIAWLKQQDISRAEAFWREQLRGFTAPTRLDFAIPPDKSPKPNDDEDHYAQREISLPARETSRVRLFAQSHQLTLSTLIRGAWALLLGRYSRGEDVVFGVTLSGRSAGPDGVGAMVGMFINTLPARIPIPAGAPALPWLKRIQQQQLEIQQYERCPLPQVSAWSDIPHGESLFESILVFENYPIEAGLLDRNRGMKVSVLRSWERTNYPLTAAAAIANDSLSLQIGYDQRRFDESAITRMLGHMRILLEAIISDPEQALSNLSLLSREEQHQCLVLWNETQAEYPREQLAHELFERQAECNPERVALSFADEQITYGDLNKRANQLAHYLRGMAVRHETVIGLCAERSIEMVVGLLGILKAGGVYLPLAHSHPAERLGFMQEDAAVSVLLTTSYAQSSLPPPRMPVLRLDLDWEAVAAEPETAPVAGVVSGNTAYVIYTSGSTGNPKGVMITHEALCNHLFWMQETFPLTGDDCLPQKYSLSFDVSVLEILYPLTAGARLEIARPGAYDDYLIDLINERRITAIDTVPSMLRILLSDDRFRECRSLKRVICGGEALPFDLQESFFQSLNAELHNLYGPTETTISSTFHTCRCSTGSGSDRSPIEGRRLVPIGRPIANTQAYILDHQTLPAPIGVPGENCIAGVGLARGYLNHAALTAEKFIPDPFNPEPGRRFYRTGDLGRYSSDGVIEYLGREDDQVKIRGFRMELGEIETALTGHAAVREAVVLAREDRPGVKRLAAYVVVDHENALSVEELTRFVEKKLPGYMVPATIVMRTELPLTVNGKVDRVALLSLSANGGALPTGGETFVMPRTNTERILAEIWVKVLGLERVSILDNFFALGGDSILSLQIIARAGRSGLRLTPRQIFENQTVAALAAVIDETATEAHGHRDRVTEGQRDRATEGQKDGEVEDTYALSPIQQGLLFHSVYEQQPEMYVGQLALEIKGKLKADAFERAWRETARRHAALRALFIWDRGERPIQVVRHDVAAPFEHEDWRALSRPEQEGRLDSLLESDRRRGFILSQAPLMRLTLIRVAEEDYWFIWSHHHLILDGWSVPIVLKEVIEFHRTFCQGERLSLEPSRPFREYVAWLAQQDLSQAEAYWRKALGGFTAPTPLLGDRPAEKSPARMDEEERYEQQQVSLSIETTDRLRAFARRNQLTLNTLIQGGWALLLGQYSREDDVVFGVTLSGRSAGPPGVESMVGMFINTLPMRIRIQPDAPVVAWLKQIQRRQLELTQYEYSPLSQVQAWSDIPRGTPLFESILVFENYPIDGSLLGRNEWLNVSVLRSWDQTNYPITVAGVIADDSLLLQIGYERRRFDEPAATRMLGHLKSLLESVADDPEAGLSILPSLTDEEKRQLSANGEANRSVFNSQASPAQSRGFVPPRTRTESILADIWAEVLGLERVGIEDNFFALGGDSILSLQIVARANNAGLPLTPRHIFEHRTIAELAAVVSETSPERAEQGSVSGPAPLTPIQCWFFEQKLAERHHYNQAVLLEAKRPLAPDLLRESFRRLLSHHDALRLRFTPTQSGWDQFNAPESDGDETDDFFSLAVGPPEQIASVQAGLDLERGPLVRAALLRGAGKQPDRLLIAIHHLAVDAVSWRVLLEDLQAAYWQLSRGEQVELPPKTTSFKRWAEALREYVERERQELEQEAAYWLSPSRREVGRIPVDAGGENLESDMRSLAIWLSEERTRALVREAQAAYRTEVSDLLLAALCEAFREWTGERRLLVDLEGHGREEIIGDVNVARTVGWFTTIYPVLLEAPAERDAGGVIKSVKEQLRGIPNKGINYGVLRYLCGKKKEMEEMPQAEVSFNYLGRLEQGLNEGELFKLTTEACGRVRGERNERRYLLDVEASVTGARLRVEWEYNERIHRPETIERLAGLYIEALERLISHCLSEEAGGFTPSDFPLVRLEQKQIDEILGEYGQIEDVYGLSPMQQGLLFHTLYETEPGIYIEQVSCAVRGDFNLDLFDQAWRQTIERHAILRTGFSWEGFDEPMQVVLKSAQFSIERYDWSGASSTDYGDYAQRLDAFLKDDRERGFDLGKAPLMRFAVIRVGHNDYKLVWTSHHLLLDGWSMSLLFKEVFDRYDALYRGAQLQSLQFEPSRPYRDYIVWLKRRKLQDQQNAETFWRLTLKGFSSTTPLAVDRATPGQAEVRPTHQELELSLPISLTIALQEAAKKHQLTLNTFVQGAWALLLSRYSGEDDLVFGSVVSGRPPDLKGVETMIGLFINTLPVRVRIPLHTSSRSWLEELQDSQAKSRQFEYVSLLQIQEWSEIPRPRPLFESVVVFENYPMAESLEEGFEGFAVSDIQLEERASYPLALIAVPGAKLQLRIAYDCRRFDACSVIRMSGHLQNLLEQMADHPDRPIIDLRLLTKTELEQVLFHWNETSSSDSRELLLHQRFEEQAERTPDATAVVFEGEQLTYGELNRRANQLAHYLCRLGVGTEKPVGVLMERSVEMIVGILGVLKAGGVYAPLDPSYPPERLSFMIEDAQVSVLLAQRDRLMKRALPDARATATTVFLDSDWDEIAAEGAENPSGVIDIDNAAYIIYTSGSTGTPKGVIVTHRGLSNLADAQRLKFQIAPETHILQFASLSFDASIFEIVMALCAGATLCLARREDLLPSPEFVRRLEEQEIGCMTVPPSFLRALPDAKLPAMSAIIVAGEACPEEAAIRWAEGRRFYNAYGPSEAAVWTTIAQHTEDRGRPPIGRPITNTEVYLLDRYLRPMPPSLTCELYIGGKGLARGYQKRAETTAAGFIPHPFSKSPGARLYRTGDLARYLPDRAGAAGGDIEYIGRADNQVKVRGYRIELGEIEAILDGLPMVRRSAVIVNEDEAGDKRLIAYIEPNSAALDSEVLKEHLRDRVPEYMIPALSVSLDEMPLLPNGKIDRRRLSSLSVGPVVDNSTTGQILSPFEEITANIFSVTLGIKRVGKAADFFALGGHSLSAIQVVSRMREICGVELPIRAVFETPTVKDLAKRVAALLNRNDPEWDRLKSVRRVNRGRQTIGRRRTAPLSPAQLRLWFLDRLEPGSDLYNIPIAVLLEGQLDVAALRDCFNEIVRRHEALRTTFEGDGGEPIQVINSADIFSVSVIDLSDLDAERRMAETEQLMRDEARRPFDLTRGPLLRVTILRLEEERHVLSVTMHHIVSDGWSMNVLARETTELYQAFTAGEPSPLPDLPIQYADYAIWQREALTGEFLGSQLDYWKGHLRGAPARLTLPQDKSRPKIQTYNGATRSLYLSEELSDALMALSRREGVTLFMTLLSGFTALLSRYTNQDDIVVGAPVANRAMIETESLIGFFVNTLALRTDLSGDPSFEELLRRGRETTIDAYANQDFPFEKLVEELQPERDPSRPPLFQVLFLLDDVRALDWRLPGLTATALELESATSKFDLSLLMANTGKELQATIEYNTDLFESSTIERMAGSFERLLESVVAGPGRRLWELELLGEAERRQLLVEWNGTGADYPAGEPVHQLFEAQAARAPDSVAAICGYEQISYRELNRRANQLAAHLRGLGVGPEVRVGVLLERSVEMVVALLGVLKAGGAYVPLDPQYPQSRLTFMLEDAQAQVLLTQRSLQNSQAWDRLKSVHLEDERQAIASLPDLNPSVEVSGRNLAYVIYTSGSTGAPKGVAIEHHSATTLIRWAQETFDPAALRVMLTSTSLCFDLSVFELFVPLSSGAAVVIADNALALPELPARESVTLINTVPSAMAELTRRRALPAGVRVVNLAGEALGRALVEAVYEQAPSSAVYNLYGPSEDTTYSTWALVERGASCAPAIGRPIANTQAYVLDGWMQALPMGVAGELYLSGEGVARGYLSRPEMTAERFVPNPYSAATGGHGERMYRTGDLVRYAANGELEYLGRIDQQVKVRGFRIEPLEVEAALAEFPGVKESVVLAVGTADERRLAAYFTTVQDSSISVKDLRSYLRNRLPEYMIPSTFASLSQLPLTPNGKIDRKALPALTPENPVPEESFVAPRDIVEEQLARIWSELLGLERVGVYDNFFDLGGHSLLAVRLQSRVQEAFQAEIPLHNFFEAGTIAETARALIAREARPGQTEKIAGLLKKIEAMSVDEIKSALRKE